MTAQPAQQLNETLLVEELLPKFFKAMADPTRLKILLNLIEREMNVTELKAAINVSQSGVSNHLACLRWCGFVNTRREGKSIYYSAADPRLKDMVTLARKMIADNAENIYCCTRIDGIDGIGECR